jgi:hypothetical protein
MSTEFSAPTNLLQLYPLALQQYASAADGNRWLWDNREAEYTYFPGCNRLALRRLDLQDPVQVGVFS